MEQTIPVSEKGQGISGLSNCGNTCYMNACLSVLLHTRELNKVLDDRKIQERRKTLGNRKYNSRLFDEWDDLRKMLWSQNCTVSPGGFVNAIHQVSRHMENFQFQGWGQSDSGEFMLFLLDAFHNALARSVVMRVEGIEKNNTDIIATRCYNMLRDRYAKDYSEILDIFYGVQLSIISDPSTGEVLSAIPEPFSVLDMVIPDQETRRKLLSPLPLTTPAVSLHECFDAYCEKERLDGENRWRNEKTGQKQVVDKHLTFWSLPEVMIINLKRFSQTNVYGKYKKNTVPVIIPLKGVSFSKYITGYNSDKYVYDLFGLCNHSGSMTGGHYTSTVKIADGRWFNFNDAIVKEVKNMPEKYIEGSSPYCLFYRRRECK
jgi:ubiquitin C-terminal hydrolase